MEKSDIKLYCFYVFQIPLAFFMSFIQISIVKYIQEQSIGAGTGMNGMFLGFLIVSMIVVLPCIILMRTNQYLKENHLGFAVMFFCMAFILNYYGKMEYDKDPRSFNFVQVLYFIISTSNIIVYFLVDGILKQVEKQKFRQQNMDHIKNQDDKDSKIIEADQVEVKTDTENVQNEVEMAQNHQETISSEQKNKEELFYLGSITLFSAIWILYFYYVLQIFVDENIVLFHYLINITFSPAFITWGYHQSKILKKYDFSHFLYTVNFVFAISTCFIGEGFFFLGFLSCAICIIFAFKLHNRYEDNPNTDKISLAIIGVNVVLSLVLLFI